MAKLKTSKGRIAKPRKLQLYGPEGVGKTTFAAGAPSPLFLCTEEGSNDLDIERYQEQPIATWQEFENAIGDIGQLEHDFKTLAVDSVDWLERIVHGELCTKHNKKSMADWDFGKGYEVALTYFQSFLSWMSYLNANRSMNIVLIAHSKVEAFRNPEGSDYDRYSPKLHKAVTSLIVEWADEVFFANTKTLTSEEKGAFGAKATKAKSTGQRICRTTTGPTAVAKNRLGMPDVIDLDWAQYAAYFSA